MRGHHGFGKVHACLAGNAAHWAAKASSGVKLTLPEGELFDEHSAMVLHLSCYAHVVAFPSRVDESSHDHFQLRQKLCPWYYSGWTLAMGASSKTYVLPIELEDETGVRELFATTYEELGRSYVAVQKMVKAALKNELASQTSSRDAVQSAIRQGYQRSGGEFFVAVDFNPPSRTVVAAIGIRRWTQKPEHGQSKPTYEIHRFFVHEDYQRQGIGSTLLQLTEGWVRSRHATKPFKIVATTLALLEEANAFYTKHSFTLDREELVGDLQMRTYAKDRP